MSTAIVWFRRDFRLVDNPALVAASKTYDRVIPVYIHAPDEEEPWQPGAASRWWLHHSLAALDTALRKRGSRLHLLRGPTLAALRQLVTTTRADAVYWNRLYEPRVIARDAVVKECLRGDGIDARSFNAALLSEPCEIATGQDGPYRVFTPFWRNVRARLQVRPPLPAPRKFVAADGHNGLELEELGLLPKIAWTAGLHEAWKPGEAGAADRSA